MFSPENMEIVQKWPENRLEYDIFMKCEESKKYKIVSSRKSYLKHVWKICVFIIFCGGKKKQIQFRSKCLRIHKIVISYINH